MIVVVVALIVLVLVAAVVRPHGLPEVAVAGPAAILLPVIGALTPEQALDQVRALLPTVGFLAAILVLAHATDAHGVFRWMASMLRHSARGSPVRLLVWVFAACATTTAVLSVDATVVLLTPAVLAAASPWAFHVVRRVMRLRIRQTPPRPSCPSMLLGVNLGPNLTYTGSPATMLWRWVVTRRRRGTAGSRP
ncbi:SLC13 family permease [Rhodococcus sp. DT1]|uniref:SLC13 family permease n=1 Tax=unclassified Rhodococcus (in: high G+C Gram-positive bacteria) TaxID=192944 RepID=UPI003211CDBF